MNLEAYTHDYYVMLIFYSMFWTLLIFLITNTTTILTSFFENRWLRFIGRISFSAYIWHYHLILWSYIAEEHWRVFSHVMLVVPIFVITLILATITYHLIERPFFEIRFRES